MDLRALKYFGVIFTILWLLFYVFDREISGWDILGLVFLTPLFTAIVLFFVSLIENKPLDRSESFKGTGLIMESDPLPTIKREKWMLQCCEGFLIIMLLLLLYIELKA